MSEEPMCICCCRPRGEHDPRGQCQETTYFTAAAPNPTADNASGMVMVPREPTEAMIEAGANAIVGRMQPAPAEFAATIWSAMLSASSVSPAIAEGEGLRDALEPIIGEGAVYLTGAEDDLHVEPIFATVAQIKAARAALAQSTPDAKPDHKLGGREETWASINDWCDTTFGLATVPQIIARAKEEFDELELVPDQIDKAAIEAADVVICLCRIPGFAEALQSKMAINRKRKWRLVGNGTGYHIPEDAAPLSGGDHAE